MHKHKQYQHSIIFKHREKLIDNKVPSTTSTVRKEQKFVMLDDCASPFEIVSSFADASILDRYDGFLVDQWGVMHNGQESMEGAPDCIRKLAGSHGKKLVILSNSPGGEADTLAALKPLGFDPSHFVGGAVTSGDLASKFVLERYGNKNCKALFMAWDHPAAPAYQTFLEGCGNLNLVTTTVENPDVLIVQGAQVLLGDNAKEPEDRQKLQLGDFVMSGKIEGVLETILKDCSSRNIPMVCVDPDFLTYNPDGTTIFMPGTIAKLFEELGGNCFYFGKPHKAAFEEAIGRLKKLGVTHSRMAMVGDSLHHDVLGANEVGLDSILVLGGVHRRELGHEVGDMVKKSQLEELFAKHQRTPTVVAPVLRI